MRSSARWLSALIRYAQAMLPMTDMHNADTSSPQVWPPVEHGSQRGSGTEGRKLARAWQKVKQQQRKDVQAIKKYIRSTTKELRATLRAVRCSDTKPFDLAPKVKTKLAHLVFDTRGLQVHFVQLGGLHGLIHTVFTANNRTRPPHQSL